MKTLSPTAVTTLSMVFVFAIIIADIVLMRADDFRTTIPVQNRFAHMTPAASGMAEDELTLRFQQAVVMLHAGRFEHAVTALHRVLELAPRLPEAYVNMGYALLGLKRYKAAEEFFTQATNINPYQGNAYWGLAEVYEKFNDLPAALGAMRTYIHLAKPDDPYLRRARSALWEWEYQLERGPLPDQEKKFLRRGAEQWQQRNSPDRDRPDQEKPVDIEVKSMME